MSLISKAAFFTVCAKCHRGVITCADGTKAICSSKCGARWAATLFQQQGLVQDDEMPELMRQINTSTLPEHVSVIITPAAADSPAGPAHDTEPYVEGNHTYN